MPQAKVLTVGTHREVAEFFGVGVDSVKRWSGDGMPGRPGRYPLAKIVQWLRKDGPWRPANISGGLEKPPDPRTQLWVVNGQIKSLELQYKLGQVVPLEMIRQDLTAVAAAIRSKSDDFRRRFGDEAAMAWERGVADAFRAVVSIADDRQNVGPAVETDLAD